MSAQPVERWAVASLVAARVVYAVNWLNIGALFYLMSSDLNSGVSGLGTLTSSFYLGVGLMQVPGGVLAAKWGPKNTVTTGMLVSSLAVLATSVSTSLPEVVILRFIVGSGMALVFSPAVVLATRFLGGRSGVGAGLINSAFDVGGLLGLFGWILIASVTGWRPSLVLSGGLGLLTGLLIIALVPRDQRDNRFTLSSDRLRRILRNRNLVLLGLAALGSNMGSVLISSFMVFYLQSDLGEAAATAGFVASLVVMSGVEREYESLTIGWVNCISLTGSVWPPIIFSYLARSSSYSAAWLGGAGLSLIFLIPIFLLAERASTTA